MRKYQPSNKSEGCAFIAANCEKCKNELFVHTQNEDHLKCDILSRTMIFSINDPEYPEEWNYNEDGNPRCSARIPYVWDFDSEGEPLFIEKPTIDPNQLSLL